VGKTVGFGFCMSKIIRESRIAVDFDLFQGQTSLHELSAHVRGPAGTVHC